ncbi:MAG: NAD(+) diphosphatase [Clostridia bacterium]|nr:NAD(+) diphosphatase [Clostridia bacterium]
MLQDLEFGRLENEYRNITAASEDLILCFHEGQILLSRAADGAPHLPRLAELQGRGTLRYAFRICGQNYFLWLSPAPITSASFTYESVRLLRDMRYRELSFAAMTGLHLYEWYRTNRLCGCCGAPMEHGEKERMLRCPDCGSMIFPRINPAVIVAVTDGDRLLLSKYAGRAYTRFALLAGYTEIGETVEETVRREVMEEVGLHVKNLRYYKSQPWGVDGNLLMGFFCDVDGSDAIHIDENELSMADWYPRDALPAHDDGFSLTREMIGVFEAGNEPK